VFGLREYVSTLVPWWQYVLGGVYVLTILYLPTGLMGIPVPEEYEGAGQGWGGFFDAMAERLGER
jgi:hypothetical protein